MPDTVYLKHKYITNPTGTAEDDSMQEFQKANSGAKRKIIGNYGQNCNGPYQQILCHVQYDSREVLAEK